MFSTVKKARIGLLVYSLLGIIAIGVCYITDFVNNDVITWSAYVMAAVPVLFLSILPLCFSVKHKRLLSLIILSGASLALLYLLDIVSPGKAWFGSLAFPIALQALASLWVSGLVLHFVKLNKWFLSAALLAVFGSALIFSISNRLDDFIPKGASPLINIVGIFSVAVVAAGLCVGGYIQRVLKGRRLGAQRAAGTAADSPSNRATTDLLEQPTH